jgi:uncharacterized membrane protein
MAEVGMIDKVGFGIHNMVLAAALFAAAGLRGLVPVAHGVQCLWAGNR